MPIGYVDDTVEIRREDTPIGRAFVGMLDVTKADVDKLFAVGLDTVGKFAKQASIGDLTYVGVKPEQSIRLIAAFGASPFADLLDYFDKIRPSGGTPTPAVVAEKPASVLAHPFPLPGGDPLKLVATPSETKRSPLHNLVRGLVFLPK